MKKFGIIILCESASEESYVDNHTRMYNTYEEAVKIMENSIYDEIECLMESFSFADERVEDHYEVDVNKKFGRGFIYDIDEGIKISKYYVREFGV